MQLLRIVDVNVKAGSHMKTKSIAILQSFVMVVGLIVAPAYGDGEHAGGGEGAVAAQSRPGVTPPASADSYLALERITKGEEIKAKSDARGDEEFTLKKEDLNGKFSKWIIAIENMHAKDAVCKDVRGAKQVDDLLRKYVGNLSDELNQASKTNDDADRRIDVKNLYAITEALRTVLAAQLEAAGGKKLRVQAQNKSLLDLLEKTNVFVAGVENQAKLDEKFKADLPALLGSKINDSIKAGEESLKLEEIVAKAKESIAKGDGEACEFSSEPAKTGRGKKQKDGDSEAVKKLKDEMEAAAKKKEEEHKAELEKKDKELKEIIAGAQKRTQENAVPALGNKPGEGTKPGGGTEQKDPKGGAGGGAGSESGSGGSGGGSGAQNSDPAYPDLNAALGTGINGQLGDLAALEEAYRRQHELDNLELQKALLAQQQPFAPPSFSSKSATPAPPPPPASPPQIPPVAVGATNPPPPFPPMQPMPPMGGMPPYGMMPPPPPPPVAPVPVKTETTTETEERYTPPTSMVPPIQLPMPMPQPQQFPTVVNDVNIMIRYPNGQTATWPANQPIPAGAVQVTNSNPYATGGSVTTRNSAPNTSTITGMVSSVNTSNRTGTTTQSSSGANVNSANPNGQRGGLTW